MNYKEARELALKVNLLCGQAMAGIGDWFRAEGDKGTIFCKDKILNNSRLDRKKEVEYSCRIMSKNGGFCPKQVAASTLAQAKGNNR
ncbi:MAG: hypothetical protein A2857_00565 [Candidatus Levybacteria bacterium RIFCSPHIGHO2_01_FULL_36_15]|nr:MAG: hypothetical protein A2857_00565 [Candidatus Levybacteria bacterium RIFCSPHIGHO2_01_FULL_36_15]OGH38864.1 MAG: hypothetical protein A2905_05495 [Candidatus Levybacteria bacterium RIFCSPLOWO2_01_FULL_36_10]